MRLRMSSQDTDSIDQAQNEILKGEKREPDYAVIKRHQDYQYDLQHGKRLIPFLLVRAGMIILGFVSAAFGLNFILHFLIWSATWFSLTSGVVLFFGGLFLALRGLFGKSVTLGDVFYFFS